MTSASIALIIIFVLGELALLRDRSFPYRRAGLISTAVGLPLLLAVDLLMRYSLTSLDTFPVGQDPASFRLQLIAIMLIMFLPGLAVVLAMLWLFRAYGILAVMALLVRLLPEKLANKIREQFSEPYPHRLWWLPPLGMLLITILSTGMMYWMLARTLY